MHSGCQIGIPAACPPVSTEPFLAMRRSSQMLMLGLAVFVIGAGVVLISFLGSGGDKDKAAASATTTTVQAGTVVVNSAAVAAPTSFTIPEGKQAVAVQVPFVAGLAGYAKAGDHVNVYGNVEKGATNPIPPATKLILPDVQVLAVTGPAPGTDGGNTTYLLALDASQAEQAIFFAKFDSLWMTLVPKGQPAPAATPGRSEKNAF
jgi:Flp pilus assembly protein CpaB